MHGEVSHSADWAVLLVNSREARILRGSAAALREVEWLADDVHGRHAQGGWSQARFQRGVETEIRGHVARATEELVRLHSREPVGHLAIGATPEVMPEVERRLRADLRAHLVGTVHVDIEHASAERVRDAVMPLVDAAEASTVGLLFERLRQAAGRDGRAATGPGETLAALGRRQVEVLFVEQGLEVGGVRCPRCGWLSADRPDRCPVDGAELTAVDSVIPAAADAAARQGAAVVRVSESGALAPFGGVAALLRF